MLGLAVPAFINVALLPSASRSGGGDGFAVLGIIIIGIPLMLLCSLAGGMAGLISDRRTAKIPNLFVFLLALFTSPHMSKTS